MCFIYPFDIGGQSQKDRRSHPQCVSSVRLTFEAKAKRTGEATQKPQANIVVFRYVPKEISDWPSAKSGEFQWRLRRRLIESGEYYIVPANDKGTGALRVVIMNPLTQVTHFEGLLDALRQHGQAMLKQGGNA